MVQLAGTDDMTNLLLYQRIAHQLAEDIRRGVYRPGERVPSVRKMSMQLNVSHATVLQAYANLEDQGMIRARPQSGFYVHHTPALTAPTPDIAQVERPTLVTRSSIINQVLSESRRDGLIPLGAAVPHVDYLPARALHQQLAKVTRFQSQRAFSYMFSPGYEPLRRQVAIRMRDSLSAQPRARDGEGKRWFGGPLDERRIPNDTDYRGDRQHD